MAPKPRRAPEAEPVDEALLPDPDEHYPAALKYVGPIDVLEIGRPDGTRGRVRTGGTFKTTDDHAATLVEQSGNWEES